MSGGEQQMLAMGRALMAGPKMLLLDEPSLGLAPVVVDRIFETIREINAQGVTILLVEQNANYALDVAARGYVLETGKVALSDQSAALRDQRGSAEGLPRAHDRLRPPLRRHRRPVAGPPLRVAAQRDRVLAALALKGYSEKPGLGTGLLLSVIGLVVWLVFPSKPGSKWRQRFSRRGRESPTTTSSS